MKMKLDIATLHEEERRLATSLLKRLNEKSAKTMRPEDSTPKSPNAPKTSKPSNEVPSKQMTAGDFLDLVEKYLSGLSKNNPTASGLGLKQGNSGDGFVDGSEWTISDTQPPKPKDQIDNKGKSLTGDERIAFYAHPPGETVEDVPITVSMIKRLGLAPPALGSPTEGRDSQSSQTDKSDKSDKRNK
jgi:hypothetical protein